VYQYFPNKDSIFSELLKRKLDEVFDQTASAVAAAGPDLDAQCRAAIRGLLGAKAREPKLHHALKTQLGRLDGVRLLKSLKARSLEMCQAMLAAHAGSIAVADIDRAAFLVVHAIDGVVDAMLIDSPASLGDPRIAEDIAEMVLRFLRG